MTFICAFRLPSVRLKRDISYGVYLWHYPLAHLLWFQGVFRDSFPLYLLSVLLLAVGVAYVSSYVIEVPGIRLGRRIAKALGSRAASAVLPPVRLRASSSSGPGSS